MSTLDDLLALLPDNDSGQITAADLRTIVAELWVHTYAAEEYAYAYTNTVPPSSGNINVNAWSTAVTAVNVNDVTSGQQMLATGLLDKPGTLVRLRIVGTTAVMFAKITGPATVVTGGRVLHVVGQSCTGAAPTGNSKLSMTVLGETTAGG